MSSGWSWACISAPQGPFPRFVPTCSRRRSRSTRHTRRRRRPGARSCWSCRSLSRRRGRSWGSHCLPGWPGGCAARFGRVSPPPSLTPAVQPSEARTPSYVPSDSSMPRREVGAPRCGELPGSARGGRREPVGCWPRRSGYLRTKRFKLPCVVAHRYRRSRIGRLRNVMTSPTFPLLVQPDRFAQSCSSGLMARMLGRP